MTHQPADAEARYVAWARKGMTPWFSARKRAVQLVRDGTPIPEACRQLGVDRQWLHKWWRRFNDGGKHWDALRSRSSRPRRMLVTRHLHAEAVLAAKKRFPHFGAMKLKITANLRVSHTTVHRILQENNACKRLKKVWKKWRRFRRPFANYLWQIDITQVPTKNAGWVYIATVLDDHSRFILASRCYEKDLTQADTIQLVRSTIHQWGAPKQILTDHGCQFDQVSEVPSLFTQALDQWGIRHIMGRPHHPRTQGKIERWHKSLKHEWFCYRDVQEDAEGVRHLLSAWIEHYNTERPHWALDLQLPVEVFAASAELFSRTLEIGSAVNEVLG